MQFNVRNDVYQEKDLISVELINVEFSEILIKAIKGWVNEAPHELSINIIKDAIR